MINLYQQRDFGEKINATFTYTVQQFRSLGMALLYIAGPVTLLAGIAGGIYQSNVLNTFGSFQRGNGFGSIKTSPFAMFEQLLSPAYWLLILFTLFSYALVSLTVYSHLKLYARSQGEPISVGAVWQEVQTRLLGGLGVIIVTGLAVVMGFLLLIIPGLYISIPLSLALAVFVFEDTDIATTFSRCFKLINDKWWSTFGLVLVMTLIAGIVGAIFSIPVSIIMFMKLFSKGEGGSSLLIIITQALAILGSRLLSALVALALGFQYFNLVERQEGTGLLSAINSIGTTQPPPPIQDECIY